MSMLTSSDEVKAVNPLINGVDDANLMSVDSTEPFETKVDEKKVSEGDIGKVEEKEQVVEEKVEEKKEEEKEEVTPEKKEEKPPKEEEKPESTDSKSVQKRIGKLTKKMRTAERESEALKKERDSEKEKRIALEKKLEKAEIKTLEGSKPRKTDFEDEDEYSEALMDWKVDMKFKSSEKEAKVEEKPVEKKEPTEEEEVEEVEEIKGLEDAIANGRKKYKDFKEVTSDEDLAFGPSLAKITLETDNPEDIMYYLANNPEESKRIDSLSDIKAAREIGNLEIQLKSTKKVKKQSKAPEPITSVKTDGVSEKDPEKMTPKQYAAWRGKQ